MVLTPQTHQQGTIWLLDPWVLVLQEFLSVPLPLLHQLLFSPLLPTAHARPAFSWRRWGEECHHPFILQHNSPHSGHVQPLFKLWSRIFRFLAKKFQTWSSKERRKEPAGWEVGPSWSPGHPVTLAACGHHAHTENSNVSSLFGWALGRGPGFWAWENFPMGYICHRHSLWHAVLAPNGDMDCAWAQSPTSTILGTSAVVLAPASSAPPLLILVPEISKPSFPTSSTLAYCLASKQQDHKKLF